MTPNPPLSATPEAVAPLTMTLQDAFLQTILLNPEDDTPRLIFADWLDDHDQPERAEFIRAQIELVSLPKGCPRWETLTERETYLLAEHGADWRAPLRALGVTKAEFRRGVVEAVQIKDAPSMAQVRGVLEAAPVRSLRLCKMEAGIVEELARMPEAARLRDLYVHSWRRIGPRGARAVAESPHFTGLTTLAIMQGGIELEGTLALATSPNLRSLSELTLHCCDLRDDSAFALAESPLLPQLRVLNLGWNQLEIPGVSALVASPSCSGLERLDLEDNSLSGPEAARRIAEAPHLSRLKDLNLGQCRLGVEGAAALAAASHLASLEKLVLQSCGLGDEGVRVLAQSSHLAGLHELWLCHNGITAAGIAALGEATFWPGLCRLSLNDDGITDEGIEALREAPALTSLDLWYANVGPEGFGALARKLLPRLEELHLCHLPMMADEGLERLLAGPGLPSLKCLRVSESSLTTSGAAALARSPRLAGLTTLSLMDEPIGSEGTRLLASSPNVAGLRELSLCGCGVGDEGAKALAESPHLGRLRELVLYRNGIDLNGWGRALRERFGDRVQMA